MKTIIITNQPDIAADACAAGVTRIMVDLESHGKKERQASRNTFISSHSAADIAPVRKVIPDHELIVRVNPWHEGSQAEIAQAVASGANLIMLPMITKLDQLEAAAQACGHNAKLLPLVETAYSMAHIREIAAHPSVGELYIGLNDLHLSLGLDFLFEPLALGMLDWMADHIKAAGKPFGFGGIATMGSGELPAERILAEHVRLGSSCVILSSRFGKDIEIEKPEGRKQRIADALQRMSDVEGLCAARDPELAEKERQETAAIIKALAIKLRK